MRVCNDEKLRGLWTWGKVIRREKEKVKVLILRR